MNLAGPRRVLLGMWNDERLLAAIALLPPDLFVEGPPEDHGLRLWARNPTAGDEGAAAIGNGPQHRQWMVNESLRAVTDEPPT